MLPAHIEPAHLSLPCVERTRTSLQLFSLSIRQLPQQPLLHTVKPMCVCPYRGWFGSARPCGVFLSAASGAQSAASLAASLGKLAAGLRRAMQQTAARLRFKTAAHLPSTQTFKPHDTQTHSHIHNARCCVALDRWQARRTTSLLVDRHQSRRTSARHHSLRPQAHSESLK